MHLGWLGLHHLLSDADGNRQAILDGHGGLVAVTVHSAGWLGLKRDQAPTAEGSGAPGDADA